MPPGAQASAHRHNRIHWSRLVQLGQVQQRVQRLHQLFNVERATSKETFEIPLTVGTVEQLRQPRSQGVDLHGCSPGGVRPHLTKDPTVAKKCVQL